MGMRSGGNQVARVIAGASATAVALGGCSLFEAAPSRQVSRTSTNLRAPGEPTPSQPVAAATPASALDINAIIPFRGPSTSSRWGQRAPESANVAQVTFASEGGVFDPSASRDGQYLVFASTQHRPTADIYLKRVDSRVVTQLTNDAAEDTMPAISPDGARIAFASNRSGNWDIYVMPLAGGRPLQVTNDAAHEVHPSWSPDGSRLVFSRLGHSSGRWEMWITDVNDSPVTHFIGYGLFPEWCPTPGTGLSGGDRIAFQRSRERGEREYSIWTIDFKGDQASAPTEIASNPFGALINPSWSPDGKRLTFASVPNDGEWSSLSLQRPRRAELWMVDIEGTNLVKLTDGSTVDLSPVWAGDTKVFFASSRGGEDNIWSMDVADAIRLAQGRTADSGVANAADSPTTEGGR